MRALSSLKRLALGVSGPAALALLAVALDGPGASDVTTKIVVTLDTSQRPRVEASEVPSNRFVGREPVSHDGKVDAAGSPALAHPATDIASALVVAPPVAMVVGDPEGSSSTVVSVDAGGKATELGVVAHRPGAALRAATTANRGVVVTADVSPGQDLSFVGGLFLVREGEATRMLLLDVVHSSTPLVLADGRVLVSRGAPGPVPPSEGTARIDDLTVDAIDPVTREVETVASFRGYLLFIAGRLGEEVFLYRVGDGHADLIAVDVRTLKARTLIGEIQPYARDFSVDATTKRLVFVNHEPDSAGGAEWITERIDLETLAIERLEEGASMEIVPHALPDGDVVMTLDPGKGASRISGAPLDLGGGVSHFVDIDVSGAFATGTTAMPGRLGRPFVVDLKSGAGRSLPVADGARAVVAGFLGGAR